MTALLRRIEAETQQAAQAERDERLEEARTGRRRRRNPKWAVDHLLDVGAITADQHGAAMRFALAIERSHLGTSGAGRDKVDGGGGDIHARLWDASVSAEVVRRARLFVLRSSSATKTRGAVLDRLFAFNGHDVTGARPTMEKMRTNSLGSRLPYDYAMRRIVHVLKLLEAFFGVSDLRGSR